MTTAATASSADLTAIILAAVAAVGPDEGDGTWVAQVEQKAAQVATLTSPDSSVAKTVNAVLAAKVFVGTVLSVKKEATSTRGLVIMKTRESQHHPSGCESARTDRTDNPSGRLMAKRLQALTFHRVRVWVEVEEINNGASKVRVIRHVEDLGLDKDLASIQKVPVPVNAAEPDGPTVDQDQVVPDAGQVEKLLAAFAAERSK